MRAGEVIADRFEIERRAATGGMAVVFRAHDRESGRPAALKVIGAGESHRWARFAREVKMLAELDHPGIVRYLAHGITPQGERYLAMEWLDGEDLSERLLRAPLRVDESLALARHVAEALGFAHARGVVHRDVKPSNLFLVDGRVDQVRVLDFGIARSTGGEDRAGVDATRAGVRIGTPAYMSPERARGVARLDARSDVFSLGCVLYESLTGRKAFVGDDPMAVLAKILLEDPPRAGELRAGIPAPVEALVARMLSKDPVERPADGRAVVAELDALEGTAPPGSARPRPVDAALGSREQRLMCVLIARDVKRDAELLARVAGDFGARLEALSDGSALVTLGGSGAATDLAAKAARCALAMRTAVPTAPIALATGRAVVSMRFPVGDVIDRAVKMLRAARSEDPTLSPPASSRASTEPLDADEPGPRPIGVDEVTAGLLDARFDVGGDDVGLVLRAERDPPTVPARTLLGRPTPCVGRDAELSMLEAMFEAAVADPGARAVLVTAPPGVGKSRLRHELFRRLESRGAPAQIWIARGDPMSAGAPFGLLGAAIRRAAGIVDGERIDLRRRKLRARVGRHLHPDDAARVSEFMGELCGTPFPSDQSVQLRTALKDAMLLGDQMRRAWEDWLAAETDARPLVLVLEDLQWGDRPTVTFVDAALRHLRERPFLVLALARPEVHELFPRLWSERGAQEIRLAELPRRAAERLVRQVLGARIQEAAVQRIAARSAGNAFYLEELIRAAADGRDGELPETVVAMVQARLEALDAEKRRVLRAASVFGRVFTAAGVAALLGGADADAELSRLVDDEWLTRHAGGAHSFRHGLVRDAAYVTLTDGDRALGHRLAAEWLEASGEPDALVLAEHFERGGEAARAISCYRRAAEQALGGNDLAAVVERVARAASLGASGADLGELRLLEAEALRWRGELASAERAALEALRWLPRAIDSWYLAAEEAAYASGNLGDRDRLVELSTLIGDLPDGDRATAAQVRAALRLAVQLAFAGRPDLGDRISHAIDDAAARFENSEPAIAARILAARASRAHFAGNPGLYLELLEQAIERFERAGDLRGACMARGAAGWACLEIGDYVRGEATIREVLATAERMGLANVAATAKQNLGLALAYLGRLDEARAVEDDACRMFVDSGNRRMESASRAYLAMILLRAGDRRGAERKARAAIAVAETAPPIPPCVAGGQAVLASVLIQDGRAAEARDAATRAVEILESLGGIDGGESEIRLAHAEALHAAGDAPGAQVAIRAARDRLLARAERISSPELRGSFLERVPENARTLALARAWLDG